MPPLNWAKLVMQKAASTSDSEEEIKSLWVKIFMMSRKSDCVTGNVEKNFFMNAVMSGTICEVPARKTVQHPAQGIG